MMIQGGIGNVIICDTTYIDQESGKPIVAGIYSGDIIVNELPSMMEFDLYVEYWPDFEGERRISFKFKVDESEVASAPFVVPATHPLGSVAMLRAQRVQVIFEREGRLSVEASINEGESRTVLLKAVNLRTS